MRTMLHLIATQPQLLVDHAEAYADLVASELRNVSALWKRIAVLNATALCLLGVAAVLAGVALMLWAVIPSAQLQAPWALVVTPALPFLLCLVCLYAARMQRTGSPLAIVREQVKEDMLMLRELNA